MKEKETYYRLRTRDGLKSELRLASEVRRSIVTILSSNPISFLRVETLPAEGLSMERREYRLKDRHLVEVLEYEEV